MIPEKKGLYHGNDDCRYSLDRLNDLNLPVGLAEIVGLQAERVACLILQHYLTRKPGGWGFTEDVPTLATKLEQRLRGTFGELETFRNEFAPGHGTAFLVTRQLVFTAAHCICYDNSSELNPKLVNTTRVVFGFHGAKEKRSDYFFSEDQVQTVKVVAYQHFRTRGRKAFYSEWTDWALLKLDREVPWEPLSLNLEKVMNKIELYMLGHPNGLSLKFTYNGKLEGNTEHDFFECKIDAFQGNSGSPIFNATTYRVEGILIEGRKDYEVLDGKIQARQITASKIISNPIGIRMENCQRLSTLRHLVDKDLLDLKSPKVVQNTRELITHSLKKLYKSRNTIPRLLEQPLPIDTIYTELVLLCEAKQEKETKEQEEKEKKAFEENRINSWEDIQTSKEPIALNTLFENRNDKLPKRLLILGRAGIGKSTLCQYIANQWGEGKLWKEKFEAVFWVPLRKLQNVHSAETAASTLFRLCCPVPELFTNDIAQYLETNREKILLILDGLDEITLTEDSQQKKILDQFLQFPYWIVTSRPHAAGGIQADDTIENVGYASKTIDIYIQRSFQNNASAVIQKLRQNPILFGFCHIPINLELICAILKKSNGDLSKISSMTSLYEELTFTLQKRFLEKIGKPYAWDWTPKKLAESKDEEIKEALAVFELLEAIAWTGMQDRQLIFSLDSEEMEKIIEEFPNVNLNHIYTSGFLQTAQDSENVLENDYSFLHLTFQEFFAARYLVRLLQSNLQEGTKCIQQVKFDPRYKVVMWFVAGLLKNEEGGHLTLNAFFDCLSAPKDLIGLYNSLLKMRCLEECGWQAELQEKIKIYKDEIQVWIKSENDLLMERMLETFEISPQGAKSLLIPKCVSHLSRENIKLLGRLGWAQRVIPILIQVLKGKDKQIQVTATEALGLIGHVDTNAVIPELIEAFNSKQVRVAAVKALSQIGKMDPVAAIPGLIQALTNKTYMDLYKYGYPYQQFRIAAVEGLRHIGQANIKVVVPALIEAINDEDHFFKKTDDANFKAAAIEALLYIGQDDPQTIIPVLFQAAAEGLPFKSCPKQALKQVCRANPQGVISIVNQIIESAKLELKNASLGPMFNIFSSYYRFSETIHLALYIFGKAGLADPSLVIPLLKETLYDSEERIKEIALKTPRKIGQPDPCDSENWIKKTTLKTLGKIGQVDPNAVIPLLERYLYDEDNKVRRMATKALGKIGPTYPEAVIPLLVKVLHDPNSSKKVGHKKTAAKALGRIDQANPKDIIPVLLENLDLVEAIEVLRKVGQTDPDAVIPKLLRAFNGHYAWRIAIAEAIIQIAPDTDFKAIIPEVIEELKQEILRSCSLSVFGLEGKEGTFDPQTVIPDLLYALKINGSVVVKAANALIRINLVNPLTVTAIPALLDALAVNYNRNTLETIARILVLIGQDYPEDVVSLLVDAIKNGIDWDEELGIAIIDQIAHTIPTLGVPALLECFKDRSWYDKGKNLSRKTYARKILIKYDLADFLENNSNILYSGNTNILASTPLSSLIKCCKAKDTIHIYSAAIAKKCIEENLALFFDTDNNLCFYEQGKLCKVDSPESKQFLLKLKNHVLSYPEFDLSSNSCAIQ